MVKTAAKQECTAEGPGFESRLVQFLIACGASWDTFCASQDQVGAFWDLLGRAQERPKSRQESPRRPQKSAQKRPRRLPGAPAPGEGGGGAGTPQNTQNPSWKQQNLLIYSVLLLARPQSRIIYTVLIFQAPEGIQHCILRVSASEKR